MRRWSTVAATATAAVLVAASAPTSASADRSTDHHDELTTIVEGLDGPRGVDALGRHRVLVAEADGTFSLVLQRWAREPKVIELGQVPGGLAPAIAAGTRGRVYILVGAGGEPGGPPAPGSSTLYEWRHWYDAPKPVFDVAAYQAEDPDPHDLEGNPTESNPFGLEALRDGSVLIADAAGNDLIRWYPDGDAETVATFLPRVVDVPDDIPLPEEQVPSEAVSTSVTIGPDGYWYVGELRGFPATPGTSQVWRIKPGSVNAVCDPDNPRRGSCKRHADGLTSIMDLGASHRSVYAISLSKMGWLAVESEEPVPGAEIGALYRLTSHPGRHKGRHHGVRVTELVEGQLVLPAGVDVERKVYVTGPVFGPGALMKVH